MSSDLRRGGEVGLPLARLCPGDITLGLLVLIEVRRVLGLVHGR